MKMFSSITHIIFLCVFYCASLCLLRLSWAEDVGPDGQIHAGTQEWNKENFSNTNFSEGLIVSVNSVITNSDITNSAVVQSSFEEVAVENANPFNQAEFAFVDTASQNSGVFNEITDTGQAVVFTLADAATAELQQRADIPSAITSHNETPNLVTNNATTPEQNQNVVNLKVDESQEQIRSDETNDTQQTDKINVAPAAAEAVEQELPAATKLSENKTDAHEDIPSFSEWTQKQLEEAEKKKELVNTSSQTINLNGKSNSNVKVRSKNYASLDCGAKIVAANPEAVSANAILSPSRDEYKLNACTNRIWFIVELCEAIQAKKIDLANFELFSSSPKDFSVSVSDRFPTRDWMNVGQFTAKDERDVQSFDLHPHLFGKFIKVEMLSHHGSEHFCPMSLFRVYGTSEFEVLEKEDEGHGNIAEDEDDDETMDTGSDGDPPKNLLSSATDAVISIVKKAAEVLGNKANNSNQSSDTADRATTIKSTSLKEDTCMTPSHLVVCDNCSDTMFEKVYNIMSCKSSQLYDLVRLELIKNALSDADACKEFGFDFRKRKIASRTSVYSAYVKSFFSPTYLVALCNALAVIEQKVVLNISKQFPNITKEAPNEAFESPSSKYPEQIQNEEIKPTEKLTLDKIEVATSIPDEATNITDTSEIQPTKTYAPGNDLNTHSSPENKDDVKTMSSSDLLNTQQNQQEANTTVQEVDVDLDLGLENLTEYEVITESSENLDLDLMSELNNLGSTSIPNTVSMSVTVPQQAKESVFLRLSNRIKALERNMSLSSQYLEELSRRYKKQVEEMQRLLDKTMNSLNEESRKRDEHNRRLEQQLDELSAIVSTLVVEKNSWITTTYWLFLAMVTFFGILTFCRRGESKHSNANNNNSPAVTIQRRKSIAVVSHNMPQKKERRPSEEALKIRGTYKDLMIDDVDATKKKYRERKRRKKKTSLQSQRANSISLLTEEDAESDATARTTVSDITLQLRPPWTRQESAPAKFTQWDANDLVKNRIEDISVVLEESDNSPLQLLPIPHTLELAVKTNGNISLKDSPSFMRTLKETRSRRSGSFKLNGFETGGHDDTSGQHSPTPSSGGTSLDDVKTAQTPKKEKKSGFKRILRKVF